MIDPTTPIIRYVITCINDEGYRVLAEPMQGRYTFTKEEADTRLGLIKTSMEEKLGLKGLEVRPVEVYPGHFDPKTSYID